MNITIYTLTYNEAFMLPHFIAHYRRNFPGCRIVVYDNESTDDTRRIAEAAGCEVRINATGGKLDDMRYLEIKNNCWKESEESPLWIDYYSRAPKSWVIICDCDEFLDITAADLHEEETNGTTIITTQGYNMVNVQSLPFNSITHAVRATSYDKAICFNTVYISNINYNAGCHTANPQGIRVQYSDASTPYRLRHYKYMGVAYMIARFAVNALRMSENNLQKGYGGHYLASESEIRAEFETVCKQVKRIIK
jgi:hypothetical protein